MSEFEFEEPVNAGRRPMRLSSMMGTQRIRIPLVRFDAATGSLTFMPTDSPDAIDIADTAIQIDPARVDAGWRCFATGGVREHIERWPTPPPPRPAETLTNKHGAARWQFFVRLTVAIDGLGHARFEIDQMHGGSACMRSIEALVERFDEPFVVAMTSAFETDAGFEPIWSTLDDV